MVAIDPPSCGKYGLHQTLGKIGWMSNGQNRHAVSHRDPRVWNYPMHSDYYRLDSSCGVRKTGHLAKAVSDAQLILVDEARWTTLSEGAEDLLLAHFNPGRDHLFIEGDPSNKLRRIRRGRVWHLSLIEQLGARVTHWESISPLQSNHYDSANCLLQTGWATYDLWESRENDRERQLQLSLPSESSSPLIPVSDDEWIVPSSAVLWNSSVKASLAARSWIEELQSIEEESETKQIEHLMALCQEAVTKHKTVWIFIDHLHLINLRLLPATATFMKRLHDSLNKSFPPISFLSLQRVETRCWLHPPKEHTLMPPKWRSIQRYRRSWVATIRSAWQVAYEEGYSRRAFVTSMRLATDLADSDDIVSRLEKLRFALQTILVETRSKVAS